MVTSSLSRGAWNVELAHNKFIQHLPNEVLLSIFSDYGMAVSGDIAHDHLQSQDYAQSDILGHASYWAPLMLVCRFWRKLALATPTLWNVIYIRLSNVEWVKLALLRSQETPLTVIFGCGTARAGMPFILSHTRRIRRLFVFHPSETAKVDFPFLLPLLRMPQENLEELVFLNSHGGRRPRRGREYAVPVSDTHFRALQIVSLHSIAIPWTTSSISRLRCLTLRLCTITGPPISREAFLEVLKECHHLERLKLLDNFVSSAIDFQSDVSQRTAILPHLRELAIEDQPRVTSWLLSCLNTPRCERLHVVGNASPEDEHAGDGLFTLYVPPDVADRPAIFVSPCFTQGSINLYDFTNISVSDPSGKPTIRLDMQPVGVLMFMGQSDWNACADRVWTDYVKLFAGAPLTELKVRYACVPAAPSRAAWVRLLSAFTHLQTIKLSSSGSPMELVHALQGTLVGPSNDGVVLERPIVPRLKLLSLNVGDRERGPCGIVEALLNTLSRRATFDRPAVGSLRVCLHSDVLSEADGQSFAQEMALYGERLSALVKEFKIWTSFPA
ncbi:hypothetical protein BC628DRAFT_436637 [Trametes gibbosa]|nr:hypothetical protein BC628DRAFT_436637 [Trametes gibbosa]